MILCLAMHGNVRMASSYHYQHIIRPSMRMGPKGMPRFTWQGSRLMFEARGRAARPDQHRPTSAVLTHRIEARAPLHIILASSAAIQGALALAGPRWSPQGGLGALVLRAFPSWPGALR